MAKGPVWLWERVGARCFPGGWVSPALELGGSDGLELRSVGSPTYALSAIAGVDGESNEHGLNEKVREKSVYDAVAFWYDMVKGLAGARITP